MKGGMAGGSAFIHPSSAASARLWRQGPRNSKPQKWPKSGAARPGGRKTRTFGTPVSVADWKLRSLVLHLLNSPWRVSPAIAGHLTRGYRSRERLMMDHRPGKDALPLRAGAAGWAMWAWREQRQSPSPRLKLGLARLALGLPTARQGESHRPCRLAPDCRSLPGAAGLAKQPVSCPDCSLSGALDRPWLEAEIGPFAGASFFADFSTISLDSVRMRTYLQHRVLE